MRVLSINVGQPKTLQLGTQSFHTGILKVPQGGPVEIGLPGLMGDFIANSQHHGGLDQAVYIYSNEDYQWWQSQLGCSLAWGSLGENLTLSDWGGYSPRVGDVLDFKGVKLQLTAPRIPCAKLSARMGDAAFVKRFVKAARPGAYARVLQPGWLEPQQGVEYRAWADSSPSLLQLFTLWHAPDKDQDMIQKALRAPLGERLRTKLEQWSGLAKQ